MATLLIAKCQLPKSFSLYIISQGVIFFILFANFYIKTYISNNKVKGQSTMKSQNIRNGVIPHDVIDNSMTQKTLNGVCHPDMIKLKAN